MYEMLTGKVPFDADTPVSIALKHMQEEPKQAIEVNPNIPRAVNDVIMKALKKDSSLRYSNATAMLLDLKRALKEPNGNFVDNGEYEGDYPTQRISTLGMEEDKQPRSSQVKDKKPSKFVKFIKKHKVLSSIVGLFLLFAISLGGTIAVANATRAKEIAIPNLVGKTVDEAKQILKENKLNYVENGTEYSTEYAEGQIISQDPKFVDGRKIKENTDVKVVVSLGTEKTTVPVLKGLTREEAETAAKDAKIKLEIIEEISKTVEAGIIIKQETEAETEVNAGDTVKVYISIGTGIKQVVVSSVLYKDEAVAKQSLEEAGLVVEIEYEEDKTRGNGVVLKQSIASGETVDEGSTIVLTINKLAELKTGTITIDVKELTGYKDKIIEIDEETGKEVEKTNIPKDVTLRVTVDGEQVKKSKVKENSTAEKIDNISGKGVVEIKIYIDDTLCRTVNMDLNTTTEMLVP